MRHIFLLTIMLCTLFVSCSEELADPSEQTTEVINGFEVKWRNTVTDEQKAVVRNIVGNMVKVDGGFFVMGATPEQTEFARVNEYPLCYVSMTDYYICKYEITDEQYMTVITDHRNGTSSLSFTWDDWNLFLKALKEISGLNFDFPTEAQWEFAARGGTQSKGYVYPGSNNLDDVWTDSQTEGSSTPNELGIYNMADLKSEWCKDRYSEYVGDKYYVDRYISEGEYHVVRGGNYYCSGKTSKYTEETTMNSTNRFGYYKSSSLVMANFDYRYCRISARSHYFVSSETTYGAGRSLYVGMRPVINLK